MRQLLFALIAVLIWSCQNSTPSTPPESSVMTAPATDASTPDLTRFEAEIERMEQQDANRTADPREVLFIGSSSIRMWSSLNTDMAPMLAINRGFGGSTLPEVIHYAERILFAYAPQLIVLYCGENDIAAGDSAEEVYKNFEQLEQMIHKRLPDTEMIFMSMKPSLARWDLWPQYEQGNTMIRQYIEQRDHLHYFATETSMLTATGSPDSSIFIEDGLHMNAKGYAGWTTRLKPVLSSLYQAQ